MNSIRDELVIGVPVAEVYRALSTEQGYRGWWNKIGQVPEHAGGEAVLKFDKQGMIVNMRFRIDELLPNQRVRWTCVAHDMPSWVGTTLSWQLRGQGAGTLLTFEHAGWRDAPPDAVVQGWKHFCGSLQAYLESGSGQPW